MWYKLQKHKLKKKLTCVLCISLQLLNEVALSDRNLLFHSSGNEKSEKKLFMGHIISEKPNGVFPCFLSCFWWFSGNFCASLQSVSIISQPVSIFSILIITLVLLDYSLLSNNLILIWLHLQRCCVQLGHIHRCQEVRLQNIFWEHILTQHITSKHLYIWSILTTSLKRIIMS